MGQKLLIVESPAKAKTIGKYLGKTYTVKASMGHVRDLPKSKLGVDIDNNYEPKYITIRGKGELIKQLKNLAKKSDKVFLATDPDREGEAISWHLANILNINNDDKCRIEFNEITKTAIKDAIKTPRKINNNLVNAQQARRILDRLVGYKISPILWKKVKYGLSAGRVQSVTLRIVCDREKEVIEFIPTEYWTIESILSKDGGKSKVAAILTNYNNKKIEISNKEKCDSIIETLNKGQYIVSKIKKSTKKRKQPLPFTTSTLQQESYKRLNFSTKKTMSIAQQLYEGLEIKGHGSVGLITYMRTDSTRISNIAVENAGKFIEENYGKEYLNKNKNIKNDKKKGNIQDAHEAIRPTYIDIEPDKVKESMRRDQYRLYKLIWERFIASQMAECLIDTTSANIKNGDYEFKASGSSIKFDGFTKIYHITEDKDKKMLPDLDENEALNKIKIEGKQHFTQPPARYTEASLVRYLEENGIGRPSTYAPIISTLLDRKYVDRINKALHPTELGNIVNNIMNDHFKEIVDIEFTAEMERRLDLIEDGKVLWNTVVNEFYSPIKDKIETAEKEIAKITIEDQVTDVKCEKCGRNMVIKHGRFGDFLACPGFPECKNTKPIVKELEVPCPKCGGKIVVKKTKKGRKFFGCSNYPNCDFVSWFEPVNMKCDKCGSYMVKKFNKNKGEYYQCSNDECKFTVEKNSME